MHFANPANLISSFQLPKGDSCGFLLKTNNLLVPLASLEMWPHLLLLWSHLVLLVMLTGQSSLVSHPFTHSPSIRHSSKQHSVIVLIIAICTQNSNLDYHLICLEFRTKKMCNSVMLCVLSLTQTQHPSSQDLQIHDTAGNLV